jgi:hypothetical protein
MDGSHFDSVMTRLATTPLTRGQTLRGLAAGLLASLPGLGLVAKEEAGATPGGRTRRTRRWHRGDCGPNALSDGGTCRPCDVCTEGCTYDSITAAVTDAAGPATIHVCAGTWPVPRSLDIDRARTIVGAGSGPGGTVLVGAGSGEPSVRIRVVADYLELRRVGVSHVILQAGTLFLIAVTLVAMPSLYIAGGAILFSGGVSADGPVVMGSTNGGADRRAWIGADAVAIRRCPVRR